MKQLFSLLIFLLVPIHLAGWNSIRVIVVKGSRFPDLKGKPLAALHLFRCEGTSLVSIPYQWDEKDGQNKFIFSGGPGTLSENDELVFRFSDGGERCNLPDFHGYEIAVRHAGEVKYFYLLCCPAPSIVRETEDYVSVSKNFNVKTQRYEMIFSDKYKIVPLEFVYREKNREIHFMDEVKTRIFLKFFRFFHITKNETDFVTRKLGVIDGKVRGVLGMKNYTKMAFGIPAFPIYTAVEVYPDYVKFPVQIEIPIVPDSFKIKLCNDFNNLIGWKVYSSCSKRGYVVKGNPAGIEGYKCDGWKWFALSGRDFSFWVLSLLPQNYPVKFGFYLQDDKNFLDPPERFPGEVPGIGWDIRSLRKIEKKVRKISFTIYDLFAPPYHPGDEKLIIRDLLSEPDIKVNFR